MITSINPRLSSEWLSAVEFVREQYWNTLTADVFPTPDFFVIGRDAPANGSTDDQNERGEPIVGCAGMTLNSEAPFFSERYLDAPIEAVLQEHRDVNVDRERIVEVGPLASARGFGREMIQLVPIIAWCMGMRYILCTVTRPLASTMEHLEVGFAPLVAARRDRIPPEERDKWGSYYDLEPHTGVIALDSLSSLFERCTGRYLFTELTVTRFDRELIRGGPAHANR